MPVRACFAFAFRTCPLYSVIDGFGDISFRQGDCRYFHVLYTECAVALFTVEMYVAVFYPAYSVSTVAYFIFHRTAAVFESVNCVMLQQYGKGAEDSGLVHRFEYSFQLCQ